jgi:DnaJ like chaperone protein
MLDNPRNIRESFLTGMFSLLSYVASCDGKINREEIKRIKLYIKKMYLSDEEQQRVLLSIKSGVQANFNAVNVIDRFRESTTPKLIQILLVYLVGIAKADGYLVEKELHTIQWIARKLRYKSVTFYHLLKMVYAQDKLAASRYPQKTTSWQNQYDVPEMAKDYANNYSGQNVDDNGGVNNDQAYQNTDLHHAYNTLGVSSEMTDDEIRRNYKKMVSQYHPDKLANHGLTQEELNAATEDFKRIQSAYTFIKKYRALYVAN